MVICLLPAGPVSRVPFVLLSLKAQLPLLMNRPKEGVRALHDLLQYCQGKAGAQHVSSDSAGGQGVSLPSTTEVLLYSRQLQARCYTGGHPHLVLTVVSSGQLQLLDTCSAVWQAAVTCSSCHARAMPWPMQSLEGQHNMIGPGGNAACMLRSLCEFRCRWRCGKPCHSLVESQTGSSCGHAGQPPSQVQICMMHTSDQHPDQYPEKFTSCQTSQSRSTLSQPVSTDLQRQGE